MNFIETVKTIVGVLPSIIDAVTTVEKMFPEGGKGEAKLAMVKAILMAANEHVGKIVDFEAFWPVISKTITGVVVYLKVKK